MSDSPESIALVIESLGGGGAQHIAVTLANHWAAEGKAVTVITFLDQSWDVFELNSGIDRLVIGTSRNSTSLYDAVLQNVARITALRKAIKTAAPQTVISFVSTTNILTILASIGLKSRILISERNDPARQNIGRLWASLRRLTYRHADVVTANSKNALHAMEAYVPSGKLEWVPNSIKSDTKSGDVNLPGNRNILSVGRLHPQKAFDILLEGFAKFSKDRPDWHLTILGEGPLKQQLQDLSGTLGIADRVSLPGFRNPFPYYAKADIFILPSLYEGLPNVVLEAMDQGLPVIVTDQQTGLAGIVEDNISGRIITAGSSREIQDALEELAADELRRERFSAAGKQAVSGFQPKKVMLIWDSLIAKSR